MFTVASVVLHLATGMPVALLLSERIPWKTAFRVIALIPWMFPVVVVGVLWAWLYHPQFGLFNDVALRLGVVRDTVPWLADPAYAMPAIVLANLWRGYPFIMLILLAGLAAIPADQYEAAAVDGAEAWQRFRHITLPNLRFMIVLATLLDVISHVPAFRPDAGDDGRLARPAPRKSSPRSCTSSRSSSFATSTRRPSRS